MKLTGRIPLLYLAALFLFSPYANAQKQWVPVGPAGFSAGAAENISLAIDVNNTPYVAYVDVANGNVATVKKYDGTAWIQVGSPAVSAGACEYTSIALDQSGNPFIVYKDWANGRKATVKMFNGTNWVTVGIAGFSAGIADLTRIAVNKNGTIYVAYRDSANGAKATVMAMNAATWLTVGNAGFSTGSIDFLSLMVDNAGEPSVAFTDYAISGMGIFMEFDGNTWGNSSTFSGVGSQPTNMVMGKNDTPFVTYHYLAGTPPQPFLAISRKYNGTSWDPVVGTTSMPYGIFSNARATAVDTGGRPSFAVDDTAHGGKCTVLIFDGNNWVYLGNRGFSAGAVAQTRMVVDKNSTPYVAYQDIANGNKITVMRYNCPSASPAICAVLTDTASGNNVVSWNNSGVTPQSFKIYRQSTGNYILIGTVAGNVHSFTDISAAPATQSYRYKLTATDSCGYEADTAKATMHKTMTLFFNAVIANKASITWNKYEGIANPVYTVKRSSNGGPFTTIASFGISGNDTTYLDGSFAQGTNRYRIYVTLGSPCGAYDNLTSNTVTMTTGIEDTKNANKITLAPNPTDNLLKLNAAEAIGNIGVYDIMGKKLLTQNGNNKNEATIDVHKLPAGTYLLRVNDSYNATFIKQ